MKKILLTLVALVCTLSSWAYDYMDENGICYGFSGSSAYVTYFSSDNSYALNATHYTGDIVIPEKVTYNGTEYTVTGINYNAFYNASSITSISLPASITYIDSYAFSSCTGMTAVYITDLSAWCRISFIGYYPYIYFSNPLYYAHNLYVNNELVTDLVIPDDITEIKSYAFYGCNASTIKIHEGVTKIGQNAFCNCTALSEVKISNLEAWCNISFSDAAANPLCNAKKLTIAGEEAKDIEIPSSVTQIKDYAFDNCQSLNSVTFHENVSSIGSYAFCGCSALEKVNIHEGITEIGGSAFYGCSKLQSIELPESVRSIGKSAFGFCSALESVNIPKGVSSIGSNAFYGTSALMKFQSTTPIEITSNWCSESTIFMVPETALEAYKSAWPESYQHRILPLGAMTEFSVETKAYATGSDVMDKVNVAADSFDAMLNVLKLKVKGTINGYDIMTFRDKMLNLRELDLSEADIVGDSYEYFAGQHLTDYELGAYSFYGQTGLKKVVLPKSIKSIGSFAFAYCSSLTDVIMPEGDLKTVGDYAFYNCSSLKNVSFASSVTSIGSEAFRSCSSLETVVLPSNLNTIGTYAFRDCYNLRNVSFPPNLKTIEGYAFYNCSKLESVILPTTVTSIGNSAFSGCSSLREIKIPAATATIGDRAFNTSSIRDIYTWTVVPTNIGQNTFSSDTYLYATLHVPDASWKRYYWGERWSQFQKFEKFSDPYEYFYLPDTEDVIMGEDDARIDGNPDADFNAGSGLVVEGSTNQNLDEVNLESNGDKTGSIVGEGAEGSGNVNINDLKIQIAITSGKWYFFAFPFDIDYSKIHFDGQFVWRYYDGEYRAANGSGAWKNVSGNLKAGKGYIFQASKSGTLTLNIGQVSIGGEDKMLALESHTSDNAQDASWNLVGNPYTSYYELSDLGYNAPITVWNGSSYTAYSPADDDLTLYPFQAFFVQKTTDAEGIAFEAGARETRNQSLDPNHQSAVKARRAARRAQSQELRELLNIELSDGASKDKTRVVFNDAKSMEYEMECDAAKFFTNGVPQIYTIDEKRVQYAINERPAGTGVVRMGFSAAKAGEYTIAATRMDCPVLLRDLTIGVTHDLANGAYTFTSEAGDFADRFELVKGSATGIANAEAGEEGANEYYRLDGMKSNAEAKGVLIEKGKNSAKKVVKKQ